jgi:hypothetical protein
MVQTFSPGFLLELSIGTNRFFLVAYSLGTMPLTEGKLLPLISK